METPRKILALIVCFVETTVLGGAMFGWPSLVYVLQEDGLYADLCDDNAPLHAPNYTGLPPNLTVLPPGARCSAEKVALSLSYTVATVSFGLGALPMGQLYDRAGLRATRTIAAALGLAGYLQMAFSRQGMEWLILTGAACIGVSGIALLMTNFSVTKLAGSKAATVTAMYAGGMNTSFAYQIVKMAYEAGVARIYGLIGVGSFWLLVLVSSWCILPPDKVRYEKWGSKSAKKETSSDPTITKLVASINSSGLLLPGEHILHYLPPLPAQEDVSLRQFVLSSTYVTYLIWFCALHVRVVMMVNGYDVWMTGVVGGDLAKVTLYTDAMAYATLAGCLFTPVTGILTDCTLVRYGLEKAGLSLAMVPATGLSALILTLLSVPLFVPAEPAIFTAVSIFAIGRPLFYSTSAIFLTLMPPMRHFGTVVGLSNLLAGVSALVIFPYLEWATITGTFTQVNTLIIASTIAALVLPIKLYHDRYVACRKADAKKANREDMMTKATHNSKTNLTTQTHCDILNGVSSENAGVNPCFSDGNM